MQKGKTQSSEVITGKPIAKVITFIPKILVLVEFQFLRLGSSMLPKRS